MCIACVCICTKSYSSGTKKQTKLLAKPTITYSVHFVIVYDINLVVSEPKAERTASADR